MANLKYYNNQTSKWEEIKVSTRFKELLNTKKLTTDQNYVDIGITSFNPNEDVIFVILNSTWLQKDEDYIINGGLLRIESKDGSNWSKDDTFNFVVLKNVDKDNLPSADGSLIQDGSITIAKLAISLQNYINKIGTAELTTIAGDLCGAINELNSQLSHIVQQIGDIAINFVFLGGKNDGVTDNTDIVELANNAGKPILLTGGGTFYFGSDVEFKVPVYVQYGTIIKSTHNIVFNGFEAKLFKCLDVSGNIIFRYIEKIYPQWFGASGVNKATTVSGNSGSNVLTVNSSSIAANNFKAGDTIYINKAGANSSILSSTVTAISNDKTTITIADNVIISITNQGAILQDDTIALQRFFNCSKINNDIDNYYTDGSALNGCSKLYIPRGKYCSFDTINHYTGSVLEGEKGNVIEGSVLLQCDITKPLLKCISLNMDINNKVVNSGNGAFNFKEIAFKTLMVNDTLENAPVVKFQNAWNINSDSEFDHVFFQNAAGSNIEFGDYMTGSATTGINIITVDDGSKIRSYATQIQDNSIIIKGAGANGTDLSTYVVSGGYNVEDNTISNTLTLHDAIQTTVTNTEVLPTYDKYNIKLNNCEFDVTRRGIRIIGNAQGELEINDMEAWANIRGFISIESENSEGFKINIYDSRVACGHPANTNDKYFYAIYYDNSKVPSNSKNKLILDNVQFHSATIAGLTLNGGIFAQQLYYIKINDSTFVDIDSGNVPWKLIDLGGTKILTFNNNIIQFDVISSPANARAIVLSAQQSNMINYHILGNQFINNTANSISWIYSDYVLDTTACVLDNNSYIGTGTPRYNVSGQ